jgi:hypothetical protein
MYEVCIVIEETLGGMGFHVSLKEDLAKLRVKVLGESVRYHLFLSGF